MYVLCKCMSRRDENHYISYILSNKKQSVLCPTIAMQLLHTNKLVKFKVH